MSKFITYNYILETQDKIKFVDELSYLHIRNLPHSKYSLLGIKAVKIFYFSLLNSKSINLFVARESGSKIAGFIIWSNNKISINKLIFLNVLKYKKITLDLIYQFFKPINLINIFNYFLKSKSNINLDKNKKYSKIISFIVAKPYQSKGIGKNLFYYVFDFCKEKFYNGIIAVTTSHQKSAICFYDSLSAFKCIKSKDTESRSFSITYIADIL